MAIVKANNANFSEHISKGVALVDFYADWCGPCKMIAPILEQLSQEMPDLTIVKLDVDNNSEVASKYNVMSIPTIILFKDGELKAQTLGFQPKETLKKWIAENQ